MKTNEQLESELNEALDALASLTEITRAFPYSKPQHCIVHGGTDHRLDTDCKCCAVLKKHGRFPMAAIGPAIDEKD